jgi:hypothetical protein
MVLTFEEEELIRRKREQEAASGRQQAVMTEAEFRARAQLEEDRRVMGILDIMCPMDDYFV